MEGDGLQQRQHRPAVGAAFANVFALGGEVLELNAAGGAFREEALAGRGQFLVTVLAAVGISLAAGQDRLA